MDTNQPPDLDKFHQTVWEIVRQVPHGKVTTYGQIASMIPYPEGVEESAYAKLAPRWVGNAMNAVSSIDDPTIPWHRVINSKGGISLSPNGKSGILQRLRLKEEGVQFDEKEQVDFRIVGWTEVDPDWLQKKNLLPPRPLIKEDDPPLEDKPTQLSLF